MEIEKSKVYALPDAEGRITRIDGGYTISNIKDFTDWVLIDEGYGDRYNLCQGNYLPKPLMDDRGICHWKLEDGKPVERTQEEMDADYVPPEVKPTDAERISQLENEKKLLTAQVQALSDRNDFMEDCIAEMATIVYA